MNQHSHPSLSSGELAPVGNAELSGIIWADEPENMEKSLTHANLPRIQKSSASMDVLVCGGGPAGMAAAVNAARLGAKTLLVERYGRLGGMAVHAMVGPLMGISKSAFAAEVLDRLGGWIADQERMDLDYAALVQESGAGLLLHAWAAEPLLHQGRVVGARLISKQGLIDIQAAVTVDATGDGDVAFGAGAAFEQGRCVDGLIQPMSIMFRIAGVDESKTRDHFMFGSERHLHDLPWEQWTPDERIMAEAQTRGELSPTIGVIRVYLSRRPGERGINATQINKVDGTRIEDLTRAELEGRHQAWQVLEMLKSHVPGFSNAYINAMPSVIGVRETRRFLGVDYLTREDLLVGRKRADAVVQDAYFPIDIHNPAGAGQAEKVPADPPPYDIPYGCLVPREVNGLLLAGRCISGSHDAHASYRVQCICLATGAAAGVAAALAVRDKVEPRDVPISQMQEALGLEISQSFDARDEMKVMIENESDLSGCPAASRCRTGI